MSKPQIRILSNLARAGGTLVSKCLGAMDSVVLLSEIHPATLHMFNPATQAQDWYRLFSPGELPGTLPLAEIIEHIASRCNQNNTRLVIRDWAHLDFIGRPFVKEPPFRLLLNESLAPAFDILQLALVRHPVDQWFSTSRLAVMQGQLGIEEFLAGYRRFAEHSTTVGFMRFEDFTHEPEIQMQRLCKHLDIDFDPGFINHWHTNTRVSGDVSKMSRGSHMNRITPLARHRLDEALLQRFHDNTDYQRAIKLLGYTHPGTDS